MRNKKAYMRILEATVGVLIVSSVLIIVYSNQPGNKASSSEYVYNLQKQILRDISLRNDLRGYALSGNQGDLTLLEEYVDGKIPSAFGHSLRVCDLGDPTDHCLLNETIFVDTLDKEVFAEEIILSADFEHGYEPKKVKLFVWNRAG